jgi:hypothetical protein
MRLSESEVQNLSRLAQTFLVRFRQTHDQVGATERVEDGDLWIHVPARAAAVGPLEIQVDSTEVTIYLGEHTHTHISPWTCDDGKGQPERCVTDAAVDYLSDVFRDEIVVWSHYQDGRQTSGGTFRRSITSSGRLPDMAEAYLWSGVRYVEPWTPDT